MTRNSSVSDESSAASSGHGSGAAAKPRPSVKDPFEAEQQEKRYKYLLKQTDLFEHFINLKKDGKSPFKALLEQVKSNGSAEGVPDASMLDEDHRHHRKKTEKEEDAELLAEDVDEEGESAGAVVTHFTESPPYVKGGTMRPYQIEGLNWLISLFENGINGILADEMGLGKTLQTLSLLGYLKLYRGISGPHLLIVPKSTLQNWLNESNRWVPDLRSFVLHGIKEERDVLIKARLAPVDFDICITSYEMCLLEKAALRKIKFRYIVIDEAHRIKNENSMLSQIVREFKSTNRMLITGTPLQNNLHELWALLNFLLPDIFASATDFDSWFGGEEEAGEGKEGAPGAEDEEMDKLEKTDQELMMQQLRRLLQPFLLRRLKADVEHTLKPKKEVNLYVGLSEMQRKWYQKILERDLEAVNGLSRGKEGKTRLLNIVMQLRKCANHPYLFDGAEPGPPFTTDRHIVENSGKMEVLDKLLAKMRANGSRVLLFSQMSRMLDIFEDYCVWRGYEYCRIDGQTAHGDRIAAIEEYNRPGSEKFVFLLTTRAGGLGINLATADIVILYDSDWNPQVDLQAQDRAHRIGQQRQVCVFRLVTEDTIEEKVIERALQKLRLDQLVIQQGRLSNANKPLSQDEMLAMIRHGAERILQGAGRERGAGARGALDDAALEELLRHGEARTRELMGKYQNAGYDDLQRFSVAEPNLYRFEGEDYSGAGAGAGGASGGGGLGWLLPGKRERKAAVESGIRAALAAIGSAVVTDRAPVPRLPPLHDYQFYPGELGALYRRETLHHQRMHGYRLPVGEGETGERRGQREAEQHAIDTAEPLTPAEEARKARLLAEGFGDWTRRDLQAFLRGCERHGRDQVGAIAADMDGSKTAEQVRRYARVFWRRVHELADAERIVAAVERGEARLQRNQDIEALLERKIRSGVLAVNYALGGAQAAGKGRHCFTPEEDEFLLRHVHALGYSSAEPPVLFAQVHARILAEPAFVFDFFFKTRSTADLSRRFLRLMGLVEKEALDAARDAEDPAVLAGRKRRAANREPWEKLAEKAAHDAIQQLKARKARK